MAKVHEDKKEGAESQLTVYHTVGPSVNRFLTQPPALSTLQLNHPT